MQLIVIIGLVGLDFVRLTQARFDKNLSGKIILSLSDLTKKCIIVNPKYNLFYLSNFMTGNYCLPREHLIFYDWWCKPSLLTDSVCVQST